MIRNYSQLNPGPSNSSSSASGGTTMLGAQTSMAGTSHQSAIYTGEPPVNLASKVAEVFLTAGHAFQKLGDLTLQLHSPVEPEECKWTDRDVDNLRDSLTRFAHELDMISQSVQGRTTKYIKTDIKRRHLMPDEPRIGPPVKRSMIVATPSAPIPKRITVPAGTQPKPVTMSTRPLLTVPQTQRITVQSVPSGSHSIQQPITSQSVVLTDPGHHYMSAGQ